MDVFEKMELRRRVLQAKKNKLENEKISRLMKKYEKTRDVRYIPILQNLGVEADWKASDDEWAEPENWSLRHS